VLRFENADFAMIYFLGIAIFPDFAHF